MQAACCTYSLVCTCLLIGFGKGCMQLKGEQLWEHKKKRKISHTSSDAQEFVPQFQPATLAPMAVRKKSKTFIGKVTGGIAKQGGCC